MVLVGDGVDLSAGSEKAGLSHDLGHFAVVGPGVHHHRAAQGAGDAVGEHQALQPVVGGEHRQPGQQTARAGKEAGGGDLVDLVEQGGVDGEGVQPMVGAEQVGAVAHDDQPGVHLPAQTDALDHFLLAAGKGHQPDRPADVEGGVAGERFVHPQLQLGTAAAQVIGQFVVTFHNGLLPDIDT